MTELEEKLMLIVDCMPDSPFKQKVRETHAEALALIDRLTGERAILRDSAIDVIAWCDKTESGGALYCVDRLRHALEVLRRKGHVPDGDIKIDGGDQRDITIHPPKVPPNA